MKERLGMTDMRKYANRMNFGEIGDDVDQSDLGVDLGQLQTKGASGSGKVTIFLPDKNFFILINHLGRGLSDYESFYKSTVSGPIKELFFSKTENDSQQIREL